MGKNKRPIRRATNRQGLQEYLKSLETKTGYQEADQNAPEINVNDLPPDTTSPNKLLNSDGTANKFETFDTLFTEQKPIAPTKDKLLPGNFRQNKPATSDTFDSFLKTPEIQETTKQPLGQVQTQAPLTPEQIKLQEYGNNLQAIRTEIETRMKDLDKTDKLQVNEVNELVSKFEETSNRLKKEFPIFTLHPAIIDNAFQNFPGYKEARTELSNYDPTKWTKFGIDEPLSGEKVTDQQAANNYQLLTRSLNGNISVNQAEKESSIWGTAGGRMAGSMIQGVISIPDGFVAFGEMVSDELGKIGVPGANKLKTQFQMQGQQLKQILDGVSPADPNFAEQLSSGVGSMLAFMIPGSLAANFGKVAGLTPKVANWLGIGTSTILESVTEAGNVYRESGDSNAATKTLLANLFLIAITNRFGVQGDKQRSLLKSMLTSMPLEGLQEGMQEIISDASQGKEMNLENILTSTAIGAIIGGGTSFATGEGTNEISSGIDPNQQTPPISPVVSPTAGEVNPVTPNQDTFETLDVDPAQVNQETGFTNFQIEDQTNDEKITEPGIEAIQTSTKEAAPIEEVKDKKEEVKQEPEKRVDPELEKILKDAEEYKRKYKARKVTDLSSDEYNQIADEIDKKYNGRFILDRNETTGQINVQDQMPNAINGGVVKTGHKGVAIEDFLPDIENYVKKYPDKFTTKSKRVKKSTSNQKVEADQKADIPENIPPIANEPTDEEIISDLEDDEIDIEDEVNEAATSPKNDLPEPTQAQKEAGNYKKGHIEVAGFDISIENPRGSKRSGIDPDGNKWEVELKSHYGYFKRSKGKDGDQIDVFVNPDMNREPQTAFIVDQVNPKTKEFDEHKVMLGYDTQEAAKKAYLDNYSKGWAGLGNITEVNSLDDLKDWVNSGKTTKPFNYEKPVEVSKGKQEIDLSKGKLFPNLTDDELLQRESDLRKKFREMALADTGLQDIRSTTDKSNLNLYQNAMKQRGLEALKPVPISSGIEIKENKSLGGIEVYFNKEKPTKDQISFMQSQGMRWKRGSNRWYAKTSPSRVKAINNYFGAAETVKPTEKKEIPAVDNSDESTIVNPIRPDATDDEKVAQLNKLSRENIPLIKKFITAVDEKFGTKSKYSVKEPDKIKSKGKRPSILAKKPWHRIEHIRDSLRFKTVLSKVEDLQFIVEELDQAGFEIVKTDFAKLLNPKEWGWRFVAFDLRMPNGQLIEYYMPVEELELAKKQGNHELFEKWREKTHEELEKHKDDYSNDVNLSHKRYDDAWLNYLERVGQSPKLFEASWNKLITLLGSTRSKKSLSSSGSGTGLSTAQTPDLLTAEKKPSSLEPLNQVSPDSGSVEAVKSLKDSKVGNIDVTPISVSKGTKKTDKIQDKIKSKIKAIEDNELDDLMKDFISEMGVVPSGINPVQLAKGIKVIAKYTELGIYKFADIVLDVYTNYGEKLARDLFDAMKKAYTLFRLDAPENIYDQLDDVRSLDFDSIISEVSNEKESEQENVTDENTGRDRSLEGEQSGTVQDIEENQSTTGVRESGTTEVEQQLPGNRGPESGSKPIRDKGTSTRLNSRNFKIKSGSLNETTFTLNTRYTDNVEAIKVLKKLEQTGKPANKKQQEILSKYVGWGGMSNVFTYREEEKQEELQKLLTEKEYQAAEASTINAHFTSPTVINQIWKSIQKLGFEGGKILEPGMGVGNFIGLMPNSISDKSEIQGVELDDITAKIAKYLYPDATINQDANQGKGYQEIFIPSNSVDLVIGNVPFANIKIYDETEPKAWWSKNPQSLHNFFIAKSMDKLKPGGLMAVITSHFTMDSQSPKLRKYLAESADLVAAYKLPNDAFKGNANTEVTTDLLIFRKRDPANPYTGKPNDWINSKEHEFDDYNYSQKKNHSVFINEYFEKNPDNILGELSYKGTQFGMGDELTVYSEGNLDDQFNKALKKLPKNQFTAKLDPIAAKKSKVKSLFDDLQRKLPGVITVRDGKVYEVLESGELKELVGFESEAAKYKDMDDLRNNLLQLYEQQLKGTDEDLVISNVKDLDKQYDKFVKKYGLLNSPKNIKSFSSDPDFGRLRALEVFNSKTDKFEKSGLLKGRVFKPLEVINRIENVKEAFAHVQGTTGILDFDEVARLTGKTREEVIAELLDSDLIFQDVNDEYVTEDAYLSGEVVRKLQEAENAAKLDPKFEKNVKALKAIQPEKISFSEIEVKLGANFVDPNVMTRFFDYLFDVKSNAKFKWISMGTTSKWFSDNINYGALTRSTRNTTTFGTERMKGYEIFDKIINNSSISIYDTDYKGNKTFNQDATLAAQEKAQNIIDEWKKYLNNNPDEQVNIETSYNSIMNTSVRRKFNGNHLTMPGKAAFMNSGREYIFRPYQKNAIWRGIQNKYNLFDHPVGSGKTGTLVGLIMERKRLGLTNKAIYVTKKGLVEQVRGEAQELYPTAKILKPEKDDFIGKNRAAFLNRIKTNDWDFVVLSKEQFKTLSLSPDMEIKFANEQLNEIDEAIEVANSEAEGRFLNPTQKELQNKRLSLLEKLRKRKAELESTRTKTKNKIEYFDNLGFDYLVVDEAHNYKNLHAPTQRGRVKGVAIKESQQSYDMYNKIWWMKQNERMGVTFASGTPVSNSLVEFYKMQRYLQPERLKDLNVFSLDDWLDLFTETQTKLELTHKGVGMDMQTRLSKLVNLPELMKLYSEIADMVSKEEVQKHLKVPKIKGGKPQNIEVEASPEQVNYYLSLGERAEALKKKKGPPQKGEDNHLVITTDGRKASLDLRLVVPDAADNPNNKINTAVKLIKQSWTESKKDKGTILVFMDYGVPGGVQTNLYEEMRTKLVKLGIPKKEIAFAHEGTTENKLKKMYSDMRDGTIRVLIGSTVKLSEGVNIQERLHTLIHMDPTYKPSELEQREGRIIRTGNIFDEVNIYRLVTKGVGKVSGFDAYMYQILENKMRGIAQASNPDTTVRSAEEADGRALTYAEIKGLATGNPLIMEKIQLENEVAKLEKLRMEHHYQMNKLAGKQITLPSEIENYNKRIDLAVKIADSVDPDAKIYIKDFQTGKELEFDPTAKDGKKLAGEAFNKSIVYAQDNWKDRQTGEIARQGGTRTEISRQVDKKISSVDFKEVEEVSFQMATVALEAENLPTNLGTDYYLGTYAFVRRNNVSIVGGNNINHIVSYKYDITQPTIGFRKSIEEMTKELVSIKKEIQPFLREDEYLTKAARLDEIDNMFDVKGAEKETVAESEAAETDEEGAENVKPKLYELLSEIGEISFNTIKQLADETGKGTAEIQAALVKLKTNRLLVLNDNNKLVPTEEFKTLLSDINENPEKYTDDYAYLYSNPLPVMIKGLGKIQKVIDDLWANTVGGMIYKGLGKGLSKITPEKLKEIVITNYGLPAEYTVLKREAMDAIQRYQELARSIADNLKYSNVENKVKFTEAEQMRLSQLVKGGISNVPVLRQRAEMAIREIKELEKLGRDLETLPIETYNTKLSRARINELLTEKREFEKQRQKIVDKFGEIEETDKDNKKALKRATAKLNEKIDQLDKKIKDSYLHGNEGYLKRVYLSKEQEKRLSKYGLTRPTRLDLTSAMHRKDIPFEIRKELGEILTAAYPAAKGIMLEGKDVSLGNFFKVISENPDWSSETEIIGWKQLPKDRKLGKLSEMWVEPRIYSDINDVLKFTDKDQLESFLKQLNANWKATKTIMNPSTHLRNIYSNSIMLDFSGVSQLDQIRLLPEAIAAVRGKGKFANEFKASRLNNTTFNTQELGQYLDLVQASEGTGFLGMRGLDFGEKILKLYGKITLVDTKVGEVLGKVYQMEEVLGKAIKFIAERENGKTINEARNEANKWLFDYSDVPSIIRKLRTNPVFGLPFVTWSYKAFPRIIEAAITRPISFWKYPVIFSALMKYALEAMGIDDDDWEKIKADLPDRMLKGEWLLLPFKDENGKMQMLDLTYILPYKDVYDVVSSGFTLASSGKFNNDDDIVDGLVGLFQAPILKSAAELIANKNTYTNTPIWLDVDTPNEKLVKAADYMYKTFMPSLAPEIPFVTEGGYSYHKMRSVISGRDDYYGRTFGFVPAVSSSFLGLKTSPIELEKNVDRKLYELQDQLNQLALKRNKMLRDESLTEETRLERSLEVDQTADQIREKIQNLNIPVKNPDINDTEKAIRKLQNILNDVPIEQKEKRKEFNKKINLLKIKLNNMMSDPDAYTGDFETKEDRINAKNRKSLTRDPNKSLSKSLSR